MKVNFYATLRSIVGGKTAEIDLPPGASVQDLLDAIIARYPPLRIEMLNERGELYSHVHIFVNSRDAAFLSNGMNTVLQSDDSIGIFPAVGGGRDV